MFEKLKSKWNVSGTEFFCIFSTFAVTGTFTAFVSRYINILFEMPRFSMAWWSLKIAVLLIGYQIFLLFFGFLFGQFAFFWKYERKMLSKMGLIPKEHIRMAIFASGSGSNAEKIIEHFNHPSYKGVRAKVSLIICNHSNAGVLRIAEAHAIPYIIIEKEKFLNGDSYLPQLKKIDFLVLAGFLWKMPQALIKAFPKKIVNIHPALLPKYGGIGMYGRYVHEAVVSQQEIESGITIHYVDEQYDEGDIIFQQKIQLDQNDDAVSVAKKVLALEHRYYSLVIEDILKAKSTLKRKAFL